MAWRRKLALSLPYVERADHSFTIANSVAIRRYYGRLMPSRRCVILVAVFILVGLPAELLAADVPAADADVSWFNAKILPLLKNRCFECHSHSAKKLKGGLTLDSRSGWAQGGDTGPAIAPGEPEK